MAISKYSRSTVCISPFAPLDMIVLAALPRASDTDDFFRFQATNFSRSFSSTSPMSCPFPPPYIHQHRHSHLFLNKHLPLFPSKHPSPALPATGSPDQILLASAARPCPPTPSMPVSTFASLTASVETRKPPLAVSGTHAAPCPCNGGA